MITVIGLNPQYVQAHFNKGNVLAGLGHYEEALAAYEAAIALNPQDADAHFNKGVMLVELGRNEEALERNEEALERNEEALQAFEEAIHHNSQHANAHFCKGAVLQCLGRNEEALQAFEAVLHIDPEHADALNALNVLRDLNRNEDAAHDTSRHSVTRSSSGHSGELDAQVMVSLAEALLSDARRANQGSGLEGSGNIASGDATPRQSSDGDSHSQVSHSLNPGEAPAPFTDENASQNPEPGTVNETILSPTGTEPSHLNPDYDAPANDISVPQTIEPQEEMLNPEAHYQRGLELQALRHYGEAVQAFEAVILLNPQDARCSLSEGSCAWSYGRTR